MRSSINLGLCIHGICVGSAGLKNVSSSGLTAYVIYVEIEKGTIWYDEDEDEDDLTANVGIYRYR